MAEIKLNYEVTELEIALEKGDYQFVRENLDVNNERVLGLAARHASEELFKEIFPLFSHNYQENSILSIVSSGRAELLSFALKFVSVDISDSRLHELACRSGDIETLKLLEDKGVVKSEHSFSYALYSNNLDMIKHVYSGENISKHFTNQSHVVELPVLKFIMGQEILSKDIQTRILLGAASAGLIEVIEYLLNQAEPPSSVGALFETVYFGDQIGTMKYLLTQAPILSRVEEEDYAAFIWAYQHGYESFVDYLVNEHKIGPQTSGDILDVLLSDNLELYERVHKVCSLGAAPKL